MEHKGKGSFILMIVAIIILVLAYVAFSVTTSSIDGTNDYNNCTASTINTISGIVPMAVMIGSIVVAVVMINWYISSTHNYQKTHKTIHKIFIFLDTATHYFAFGLFAYAIFGTVAVSAYLSYRIFTMPGVGTTSFEVGKWILILIMFFFATAGVGYLFETKIWKKYKERKEEQERLETMEELPKGDII
jgi:hypothetical protein